MTQIYRNNPVPASNSNEELEDNVFKALAGHEVIPDDLQAYHHLKKKEIVIVKFKSRKQKWNILIDGKNLRNKSENLSQLKFAGKLFISESMCHENQQLAYKCRQLKNDIKKSLTSKNFLVLIILDKFINNTSF